MGGVKQRGLNFMRPKKPNVHPKDLIKTHKIFIGDLVQVVQGKEKGKRGSVTAVLRDRNLIVVDSIAQRVKHMKPNQFYPAGGKIMKSTPIQYCSVRLVDPVTNDPTSCTMAWEMNEEKGRKELIRKSEKGNVIPLRTPHKEIEGGPLDTQEELVLKKTFEPNVYQCPFPVPLMNEFERLQRKNRTTFAI